MYQSNLRVAKYEPLTFQCVHCEQQFAVLGDSLEALGADVSDHLNRIHPELLKAEAQQNAA
ncbi:MAG TPA: hypothetical protein VLC12_09895 [Terriglobales bacterium]|jgi:predicted kinase|nr:hypothetical protein [Terriglobales bacterium]